MIVAKAFASTRGRYSFFCGFLEAFGYKTFDVALSREGIAITTAVAIHGISPEDQQRSEGELRGGARSATSCHEISEDGGLLRMVAIHQSYAVFAWLKLRNQVFRMDRICERPRTVGKSIARVKEDQTAAMLSPNVKAVVASLWTEKLDESAIDRYALAKRDRRRFDELPVFLEQMPAAQGEAQYGHHQQQCPQAELKTVGHELIIGLPPTAGKRTSVGRIARRQNAVGHIDRLLQSKRPSAAWALPLEPIDQ